MLDQNDVLPMYPVQHGARVSLAGAHLAQIVVDVLPAGPVGQRGAGALVGRDPNEGLDRGIAPRGGTRARARAPRARPQSRAAPWATGWFAPKRAKRGTRGRLLPVSPLGGRPVACRGARPGLAGKPTAWGTIRAAVRAGSM